MTAEERDKLLLSDTQVPDLFITQYMSSLNGASIQIYLFMLMNRSYSKTKMTVDFLSRKLGFSQAEVEEQLFYLTSAGLLERGEDGSLTLVDIKAREVDRYIESKKNTDEDMPPQHRDAAMQSLSRSISDTFFMGRMSFIWQRFIDVSASTYKLEPNVIYALFGALQERGKLLNKNTRPAEELRDEWCKRGVHSEAELEKVVEDDRKIKECMAAMGRKKRKSLDGVDIEYIQTWILVYKMDPDVPPYLYAFLRKDKNKETVTTKQMDEILQEWFAHNIHDVEGAKAYEMKKQNADRAAALTVLCGELLRKRLDGPDLDIIGRWAEEGWEEPIIRYSYEVLHRFMGTVTLSQVDEKLQEWKNNGATTVTKARQFESEQKKKNKEAYLERKTASSSGVADTTPYMEKEYNREDQEKKEKDDLDDLLNGME